MYPGFKFIPGV